MNMLPYTLAHIATIILHFKKLLRKIMNISCIIDKNKIKNNY